VTVRLIRAHDVDVPSLNGPDGEPFESWFSQASGDELHIQLIGPAATEVPTPSSAADLQAVIHTLLGTPSRRPVNEIALIFCRSWSGNRNLQGVMFDYDGSDPLLGLFTSDGGVPRQACALFMDAFDEDEDATRKRVFAAIHELGHVFNLQHDPAENSFMARKREAWGFSSSDCVNLAAAGRGNWNFAPGGANFGVGVGGAALWKRRRSISPRREVKLTAHVGKAWYLPAESIVLDLKLSARRGVSLLERNEFDPGYEALRIWMENESGERRLYRSPLLYCLSRRSPVHLKRGSPFRHNPRISVGSRGLNFRSPGHYKVWAEFLLSSSRDIRSVRSNDVEFEVKAPRSHEDEILSGLLSRPRIAAFVAYKGGILSQQEQSDLEAAVRRAGRHPAMQHVRYALGVDRATRGARQDAVALLVDTKVPEASLREGIRRTLYGLGWADKEKSRSQVVKCRLTSARVGSQTFDPPRDEGSE